MKPSKRPFQLALRKLHLDPGEVLFVGENPERDIKGAKSFGMKTALALYGMDYRKRNRKIRADYEISDVSEILDIINKENKKKKV